VREVRNSTVAPGEDRIYTAGEKEWDVWLSRKDSGVSNQRCSSKRV